MPDVADARRDDLPVFVKHATQGVHQFGALMDDALTGPEQNGPRLLVGGLGLDKAHLGLASRCGDGLGIGCVVLLALHEGADVLRRDQLDLMTDVAQLAPCWSGRSPARSSRIFEIRWWLKSRLAGTRRSEPRSATGPRTMASAFIEAFNSRLRQECLNASWFLSVADARHRIHDWKIDYNEERPYSGLGNLTPSAFAAQLKPARKVA